MEASCKRNIKSFIEHSTLEKIDKILDNLTCTTDEEQFLKDYLKTTAFRSHEPSRMYLFLMLCHFFRSKIILESQRWNDFFASRGFNRLVEDHLNFKLQADELVDECFKLWIISPDSSGQ